MKYIIVITMMLGWWLADAQTINSVNCDLEANIVSPPQNGEAQYSFQRTRTIIVNGQSSSTTTATTSPSDNSFTCPDGGSRVCIGPEPSLSNQGVTLSTSQSGCALKIGDLTFDGVNDQSYVRHFVDLTGPYVSFNYSAIFQYPTIGGGRASVFIARIRSANTAEILDELQISAEPRNCTMNRTGTSANDFLYTGWQCATLDASNIWNSKETKKVRIEFIVNDQTGEFNNFTGTAYIDNIGCTNVPLCADNQYGNIEFNNNNIFCPVSPFSTLRGSVSPPFSGSVLTSIVLVLNSGTTSITVNPLSLTTDSNGVSQFEFALPLASLTLPTYSTRVTATYNLNSTCANMSGVTQQGIMNVTQTGPAVSFKCCMSSWTPTPGEIITDAVMSYTNLQSNTDIIARNRIYGNGESSAIYHATNFVELQTNFETIGDAVFSAYIEPCTSSFLYRQPGSNEESTPYDIAEQLIEIYPNPFSDKISINSKLPLVSYAVYAMDGKEVLSQKAPGSLTWDLDLANLSVGIYVIRLENMDHSFETRKIVKR